MAEPHRVAIIQSSYIPWRGYFDLIDAVDTFVFLDDVQFTKRDWRSRNRIKTPNGPTWLTVPVRSKGHRDLRIMDVEIADPSWTSKHWRAIHHAYARAPHFDVLAAVMESLYADLSEVRRLSEVNQRLTLALMDVLGITTTTSRSTDLLDPAALDALDATSRLAALVEAVGGTSYLSGPSAQNYMDLSVFHNKGMDVSFMSYAGYPEYPQLHGAFEPAVSVVDLIANVGGDASRYLSRAT